MGLVEFTRVKALEPAEQMGRLVVPMEMGNTGGYGGAFVAHNVNLL